MDIQEINQSSPEFLYQMLGRLEADCLYYLGNGGRFAGHLWAGNERKQIKLMRMIYRRLCEGRVVIPESVNYPELAICNIFVPFSAVRAEVWPGEPGWGK